jgi:hypothetical protein
MFLFLLHPNTQAQDPAPYTQHICNGALEAFWTDGDFEFSCSAAFSEFIMLHECADTVYLEFTAFNLAEGDSILIFSAPYPGDPPDYFYDPIASYAGTTLPPIHKFTGGSFAIHVIKSSAGSSSNFEGNWYTLMHEFEVAIAYEGDLLVGSEIQFDTLIVNATEDTSNFSGVSWNFGDGTTLAGASVSHVYTEPGTYNVLLNAGTESGCSSMQIIEITIEIPEPPGLYQPFPDEQAIWDYQYFDDFGEATSMGTSCMLYGDTTIMALVDGVLEEHSYKKIACSDEEQGYIREEDKILYFIPDSTENSIEYELYNFNLELGDEIVDPFGGNACGEAIVVELLDSVLVTEGYRKRWIFSNGSTWIEGIGSMNYLLRPNELLCVSGNDVLRCVGDENELVYGSATSCVLSIGEIPANSLRIYPNPSSGIINIDSDGILIKSLRIYNQIGQAIPIDNNNPIDVSSFPKGIYVLEVESEDAIWRTRVVVE